MCKSMGMKRVGKNLGKIIREEQRRARNHSVNRTVIVCRGVSAVGLPRVPRGLQSSSRNRKRESRMKRVFLGVFVLYAGLARALAVDTLNSLQTDPLVQQVAEGLNPETPPDALLNAWRATFLFAFVDPNKDSKVGSAFVVAREIHGDTQTLDLLTANHVLEGWCDEVSCQNLHIFDNGEINTNGGTAWRSRTKSLAAPNLVVVDRDACNDLALVRITTRASLDVTPLVLADQESAPGDSVFAIGYPQAFLRKHTRDKDPNVIKRRWSEGEVLGVTDYGRLLAGEYLTTDADALPGNSGGPVVNADGEVTGVLGLTGGQAAAGFVYVAPPKGADQAIQGASIRLEKVRTFLAEVQTKTAHQGARRSCEISNSLITSR